MKASLTVLNVSGNRLDTIEDLQCLNELVAFIASDNEITNMKVSLEDAYYLTHIFLCTKELSVVLGQWKFLQKLDLKNNPCTRKPKYRDRVITMSQSMSKLSKKFHYINNWLFYCSHS